MSDIAGPAGAGVPASRSEFVPVGLVPAVLIFLLAISFSTVLLGTFHSPTNGDEHLFLSNIHRAINGENLSLLQTAHVHLFRWLPAAGRDEIMQITIGRVVNVCAWAVSLLLLYQLGRRLLDPLGALAGVVLFAVFSYSVANAFTFRIDGLLLPILLTVALLLLNPTTARAAGAGALSALALALTIKTVLWAPAFFGLLGVGLWNSRNRLAPVLAGAATGAVSLAVLFLGHRWLIATEANAGPGVSADGLASMGTYMFLDGFVPTSQMLLVALLANPATWILLVIGSILALAGLRNHQSRRNSLILLFLASPVLSITFYTNAFPYAYLVLMPTACLLAGKAFSRFMGTTEPLKVVTALVCLATAAIPMTAFAWQLRHDHTQQQRRVVATEHQLFDAAVPYIDSGGMVASFPTSMFPISRLGLSGYRKAGVPAVTNYIHGSQPPLLIVNSASLDVWAQDRLETLDPDMRLLPQDEETIRAAYAQYRDQIYLAGRQWRDLGASERREFEIIVPGDHTLLADSAVTVDGRTFAPGATIALAAGPHELRTTAAEPDLRILWGKNLKLPSEDGQP